MDHPLMGPYTVSNAKSAGIVRRTRDYDLTLCLLFNRPCGTKWIRSSFALVSRLGDGLFWYTLMLVLPLAFGSRAMWVSVHLFVMGLSGVAVYKLLKLCTARPRPYTVNAQIHPGTAPLDRYSFPSGHTLHAAAFTLVTIAYFPSMAWLLVPFSILVALSRMVLGLHYPSDVLAGAGIGCLMAIFSLQIIEVVG